MKRLGLLAILCHYLFAGITVAQLVPDRATLNAIIPAQTLEDFETLNLPFGGQRHDQGTLNSTTIFDSSGPGLIQPGVTFNSADFFWNGDGYYALNTQTLGDAIPSRPLEGVFDSSVLAFGFDIQNYVGYGAAGTVDVYDSANQLVSSSPVNIGFFGWKHAAGIKRFLITTSGGDNYILIDNLAFGVPEPSMLTLAALGVIGLHLSAGRRHGRA